MKLFEVITENYSIEMRDDIVALLVAISAEGIQSVDMDQLKNDLRELGYTIDTKSLFNIVKSLPVVANASYNKIDLVTDVDTSGGELDDEEPEIDDTAVDKLAAKQVSKDIK